MQTPDELARVRNAARHKAATLWVNTLDGEAALWAPKLTAMTPLVIEYCEARLTEIASSPTSDNKRNHFLVRVHIDSNDWEKAVFDKLSRRERKAKSFKIVERPRGFNGLEYVPDFRKFPEGNGTFIDEGYSGNLELWRFSLEVTQAFINGLAQKIWDTAYSSSLQSILRFEEHISRELIDRVKTHFREFGWDVTSRVQHARFYHDSMPPNGNIYTLVHFDSKPYERFKYVILFDFYPMGCSCYDCKKNKSPFFEVDRR